jgi:ABC-type transport system substrate-binding protein/class 3 adenylate cyclase
VTALVADIVGSTPLSAALDTEDLRLVMGEAVALVVAEVERVGGYVKDLAGDGVLAFFGAPTAFEDDAERAVRAALAITRELGAYADEVRRSWSVDDFGVRVGVATGPVVLGSLGGGSRVEYAAFGVTVNTAARLQGAGEPGRVLVDAATHALVSGLFEWTGPHRLTLKGIADPVEAWSLVGPSRGERGGRQQPRSVPLVGREAEAATLRAAAGAVRAGQGAVLVVTGEAGIGKSRLLAELHAAVDEPADPAPLWLEGRCASYAESLPLWPFRDLIRNWLDVGIDEPELRVRIRLRRAVERLFGARAAEIQPYLASVLELGSDGGGDDRLAELSPEALQYRTFEVVGELFERLAADRPVVVAIEDLHWADPTSVQLLERVVPVAERAAVLFTITLRDERDHVSWGLRERIAREYPHLLHESRLAPLEGTAPRRLLTELVGDVLPDDLAGRVLATGEGNPFYVEEIVRSLTDAGALVPDGEGWRFVHDVPVEIPPTVERVILARIDRLDPGCHQVLAAASALGRRFGLALLRGVCEAGADAADLDARLHELQRLDLLRIERRWPQPEYRFKHALIQEAAYRTLVGGRREQLHRRAAEWLEREHAAGADDAPGLLAHHWLAAGDEDRAIVHLTRAADRARLTHALDEAIDHYRALLGLLEGRGERREVALVLFKLALALHTALRFEEADAAYQRAFPLWDPPEAAAPATATLRVAMPVLPRRVDPLDAFNVIDVQLQMAVNDRLVERWPDATIVPSLARAWDIAADGLRYAFHLREGLRWSDGEPITAADVVYGVRRILDPHRPGLPVEIYHVVEHARDYALGRVADPGQVGVRALDPLTVEFRLEAPAPYFLGVANRADCGPQPRHAIDRHGDAWTDPGQHVGSGAFRLVELDPARVVLDRQPAARRGDVGRVEMVVADGEEMVEMYLSGAVDMAAPRVGQSLGPFMSACPDELTLGPAAWLIYLSLDSTHAALRHASFRLGLAHAIDRAALAAEAPANLIVATGGVVPPMVQGHTPDIAPRHDPELARSLLERSGAPPAELTIAVTEGSSLGPMLAMIAESWSAVGVPTSVRTVSLADWVAATGHAGLGPAMLMVWFPGYTDPEYYLRLLLHSDSHPNVARFADAGFDELIERARREPEPRARLELYHRADRMAVGELGAMIPVAYGRNPVVVKPHVTGWWEYGKSWSSFADLRIGERSP